jgi:hypothetical protein
MKKFLFLILILSFSCFPVMKVEGIFGNSGEKEKQFMKVI